MKIKIFILDNFLMIYNMDMVIEEIIRKFEYKEDEMLVKGKLIILKILNLIC